MEWKQDPLWNVFMQTGRVEDYLRYCEAKNLASPPQDKETVDGTESKGTDRPRTQRR